MTFLRLDLSDLSKQVCNELIVFYEFMAQKYGRSVNIRSTPDEEKIYSLFNPFIKVPKLHSWTREDLA